MVTFHVIEIGLSVSPITVFTEFINLHNYVTLFLQISDDKRRKQGCVVSYISLLISEMLYLL